MTTTRTRTERLDELPLTRKHARLLTGSGIGWALDAMDVGLISFIMAALTAQWGLTPTEASWLGSIGFIGMALGATLGGLLADRFGRRQIFATTLLVYGLATGASALSTGLAMLMALRFLVGLGLGAELPVASTLVSEFAPRRIRGRMVVLLEAFWAVGWLAAACIGAFVVGASPEGWRWALALGCLPAVYALIVRLGLPESVRFLESRGRHEEAERVVRSFEEAAEHSGKTGAAGAADGAASPADLVSAFVTTILGLVGIVASVAGVQIVNRIRTEELDDRAEAVLATGVSRPRYFGAVTGVALVVPAALVTIAGLVWTHTDTFKQRTALHTERTHLEH